MLSVPQREAFPWPGQQSLFRSEIMRMNKLLNRHSKHLIVGSLAVLWLGANVSAQNAWTSAGVDQNWSTTGNWGFAYLPNTDPTLGLVFFDNAYPAGGGEVNNVVNTPFEINAIKYAVLSTNGYHNTFIPEGVTLSVRSETQDPIVIAYGAYGSPIDGRTLQYRVSGPGSLSVSNSAGAIDATQPGSNADHYAILDLTSLTNFTADVQQIRVGAILGDFLRPMGRFFLAQTNRIHTTPGVDRPGIVVGALDGPNTNLRGTQELRFGAHNEIESDAIAVGGHKVTALASFRSGLANPYLSLRGSDGGPVKVFSVGDQRAGVTTSLRPGTSVSQTGTWNSSGGVLDAVVTDTYVGRSSTGSSGTSTGVLTYDQGSLTTDNLYIGYHETGLTTSANAVGTVNVNGTAVLNVNNDITLSRKLGSSNPTGNLNVGSDAVVRVKGNIEPSGSGNSSVSVSGLIDLQPDGDPVKGNLGAGNLSGFGRITNANMVTVYATLNPGSATAAGQLAVDGNLTFGANGGLNYNAESSAAAGNDLLTVNGNLTLQSNLVTLVPLGNALQTGSYRLVEYAGSLSGYFLLANNTRYALGLDYSMTNQINLAVSGGDPASIKWNSTGTAWDTTSSNWFNTGISATDRFFDYDSVLFDDTENLSSQVVLSSAVYPNQVVFNSDTRNYTNSGSGRISGGASLIKQGTSMLTIANSGNDFLGSVTIQAGVLRTMNTSALGATNAGTTIASGGTLDIFGTSLWSPGEFITASGSGHDGQGAIVNNGAAQNNALRFLALAGDTLISTPSRWDLRGPGGGGSFTGLLDLNGHTLTKTGPAQFSIVDSIATNAGTILLQQGTLGLTRSIISGPGAIRAWTNVVFLENSTTGYVAKALEFEGGTLRVSGNPAVLVEAITNKLPGMVMDIIASAATNVMLTMSNAITGPGFVVKSNTGTVLLTAPSTYTGETFIQAGGLKLTANGSVAASPVLTLGSLTSTGVLDVADLGSYALTPGQKLAGRGVILGDVSVAAAAGLEPGMSAGMLVFSNNLALNNSENVFELGATPDITGVSSDLVHVMGNLTLSGLNKIKIMPLATLDNSAPYTLFLVDGSILGNLSNLQISSDSRYQFVTTIVGNAVQVQVTGSGASADLVWKGGAGGKPTVWDNNTTLNWLKSGTPDIFFQGDNVTFDDTATVTNVDVADAVQPAAVSVSNASKNYTLSGTGVVQAGSLSKTGVGGLTFGNAGLTVAGDTTLAAGAITMAAGEGTFGPFSILGGALNLNNLVNDFGGPMRLNGGALNLNPPGLAAFNSSVVNDPGTAGTITKTGVNTLSLGGDNAAFEGQINVLGGVLKLARNTALGASNAGPTVVNGGTLDLNGQSMHQLGEIIRIAGGGLSSTGAVINTGADQQNAIANLVLDADSAVGGSARWDLRGGGGSGTFSASVDLAGHTLAKVGTNRVSLVDANIYQGNFDILGGMLALTRCNVDFQGEVNIRSNILFLENYSVGTFYRPITGNGGTVRVAGTTIPFPPTFTSGAGGLTFDITGTAAFNVSGAIVGPGVLTKMNTGTLVLSAMDNNWGGGTVISEGVLQIGSDYFAGDGSLPNLPILNNGTLAFRSLASFTNSSEISGSGSLTKRGDGVLTITSSNSFTGNVNTGTGTSGETGGTILLRNNHGFGSTNKTVSIVRAELQLDGGLRISSNITFATSANADATDWAVGLVAMRSIGGNNIIDGPIILTGGGGSSEFVAEAGTLTLNGGVTVDSAQGSREMILSGGSPGFLNGVLTNGFGNSVTRPLHLVKRGAGVWTLSAGNSYTGRTEVREGALALTATAGISGSSDIDVWANALLNIAAVPGFTIAPNQVLRGEGTVQGAVTVAGEVRAGSSANGPEISTLTFANSLVLNGVTTLQVDRANFPMADTIVAVGPITLGGTLMVTNLGELPQTGDVFKLFTAPSFSNAFSSYVLPELPPNLNWDISKLTVDGTLRIGEGPSTIPVPLVYSVVPGGLEFTWPADHIGWGLETQNNALTTGLSTNWSLVPGSTETNRMIMSVSPAAGSVFFRLAY